MDLKFAAAAILSLIGSAAYAGPTNLVMNGDFSSSSYSQNYQFGTGYGGQGVTNWTGNGGYDLYFTSASASTTQSAMSQYGGGREDLWAATSSPTGGAFVALDGDSGVGGGGGISQSISGLKIGDTYALSFSWAAGQLQSRTGATTEQVQASLGGKTFLTNTVANQSMGFNGWFTTTFDYVATATTETLSFLSIGTPSGLPPIATLDGVSPTDVPEPMSFALLGMGLAGLGFIRYRTTRRA